MSAAITRRRLLAGLAGATVSTAALAVPAATSPIFVKVGSPSFSVPPEVMAAIKDWQRANEAKKVALDQYNRSSLAALAAGEHHTLPIDHPIRSAWIDADQAATQAQFDLLDLLETYASSAGATQ